MIGDNMKAYLKTIFSAIFLLLIMFIFISSPKSAYAYTVCGDDGILQNCVGGIEGLGNPPQPHTYIVEVNESDNTCRSLGIIGGQCDNQCGPIGSNDGAGCPVKCCSGNSSVSCSTDDTTTCARGAHFCVYNDSGSTWNSACTETINKCATQCTTTTKYKCNTGTKQCAQDSTGAYPSLSACNTACGGVTNPPACGTVTAAVSPNSVNTGGSLQLQLNGDASTFWSDDAGAGLSCSGGWNFDANPKTRSCTATSTTGSFTWTHSWKSCTANCTDASCCTTACSVNASYTVGKPAPPEPTNLQASCPEPGTSARFNWSASSGADRYLLSVNNGSETTATSTTATVTGMTAGSTNNSWTLKACDSSNTCSSRVNGPAFNCTAKPPATVKWYRVSESKFEVNDAAPVWKDYNPAAEPIQVGLVFSDSAPAGQIKTAFAQFKDSNNRVSRVYQNSITYRPATGPTCNSLAPVGLTDTGNIDPNGRKIYRMDSKGGVVRINASRSPSATAMTGSSTPSLTFNPDASNDGSIVATVPANGSPNEEDDYIVSAIVGSPPVSCIPAGFIIRVQRAGDSACSNFAPAGLTETGQFDYAGRRIYRTGDSTGGNVRISATRTPSDAGMTGSSNPSGVTFDRDVTNPGAIVGAVPANGSTNKDDDYVISAKIPSPSGTANCNPEFIIKVPKKQADTSCPYTSTEVKAKVGGLWLSQNVSITKGESIRIAGFHNGNTSGPPDDIILEYRGPNGETGSYASNDPSPYPVPAQAGSYTFTAKTKDKTGSNCEGSSTITVNAQTAIACIAFSPNGLQEDNQTGPNGMKIYKLPDYKGGRRLLNVTRSPVDAVIAPSFTKSPSSAPDLSFENMADGSGNKVVNIPDNDNTSQNSEYTVSATVTGASTKQCTPFMIQVPKKPLVTACPDEIKSTEARIKVSDDDFWSRENTVVLGNRVFVGGFHNGTDTPANDAVLTVTGPEGPKSRVVTLNPNTEHVASIKPDMAGRYTVTASTLNKDGANCTGTGVLTVDPGTSCPSEITSTEARLRKSDKEAWANEKEMTLGESISVAGFHNNQTEELASDIILKVTGPEGPQSSVKVINSNNNNISFKPTLAGTYRITAAKKGKSGDNCTGSSTLTVSPPAVTTTSFRIAESPADLETAPWQPYTAEGMRVEHDFKKAGDKFIFVQFMDSTGKTTTVKDCPKCQLQIKILGPDPQVLSCSLSTSGNSVLATLKGRNFGKDKGTVKSGDSNLTVKSWKDDAVEAMLSNPAVGESLPVEVANTEGQASSGAICSSLSTLSVGATFFCHSRQDRAQSNIDLALVEQTPGAKPLKQKVTIDKEGVIAGLTGVLQEGKDYKLSLKGPKTVRKTKLFTAGSGTTNVPDFVLPVGDIFPLGGDGIINTLDKAELNRQWVISKDAKERAADFNNDGRVNSIDWACMRKDFGSSSDTEPVAPTGTASSCSINALGKPLDPKQTFDDPNTVQFVSGATYSGKKSIAAARWDFQNKGEWDTDLNAESVSPSYAYPAAGEYTVRLQVQLSDGEMTPVCTKKITVPVKEEKEKKEGELAI